jgi:hypothetical protein
MITLLYQSAWPLGGGTSFTAHLCATFATNYVPFRVLRIADRTERRPRQLAAYGFEYRNVELSEVLRINDGPILHTIGDPKLPEETAKSLAAKSNFWSTCFDSNELKLFPHWKYFNRKRVLLIGESSFEYMPLGHLVPMPYVRRYPEETVLTPLPRRFGCSIARIGSSKNSEVLMEANQQLREQNREIALLGQWDRMWHWSRIAKRFPEYPYPEATGKGYPRRLGTAPEICIDYSLMFDMSIFVADGGRPQYSLLEALDAGAVPVITQQWASYPGPSKDWSIVVKANQQAIVARFGVPRVVEDEEVLLKRRLGQTYLRFTHDSANVAQEYVDVLNR